VKGKDRMKLTLFLSSFIVAIILSVVGYVEYNDTTFTNGTAVISTKTQVKGGNKYSLVLPSNLTTKQGELLAYAYTVAKADGHKFPEYYQGLIYQESKAGGMKGYEVAGQEFGLKPMERYYGVPQLKLSAAKDVLKRFPVLGIFRTDEEIIAKLITDDRWSIRIGSKYLLMLSLGKTPEQSLVAYNRGASGALGIDPSTNHYANSITNYAKTVMHPMNMKNIIWHNHAKDIKIASAL
jgi:hypothetical protein